MWPSVIFIIIVGLILLDAWRRERRHRRQRFQERQEYTATMLRQQQQAFAEAQTRQQALFNSMVDGVLLLGSNGKIQLINQSLARLLSLSTDIRGQSIAEALRWPALADLVARVAVENQVLGSELEYPGTEPRCLEVNAACYVDPDGKQQGTILVFHDITRLKQLENTRREFVANVSHELRTPLSMIKGYVETLLEGARNDPDQATRFLQIIDKHADRLTYLIEDLLTISKLESGQIVMNAQRVNLREQGQRVVEDLRARAAEKHVTVENQLPPDLWALADADRLQQVLFNLVENAIKYGHRQQGRVVIDARELPEDKLQVWVQDDGPGVPPEARERVFERFFRVDKARSRETGGTGLGLAIVKHIVQAHGGKVWLESHLGQGSTFYFTLPKA
ncbi:MAG: PAS domain-containing protein [Verrucomicrobia bacterium]|nr:PAS domain-containing protein [Verrucomicrobiota bacterium]